MLPTKAAALAEHLRPLANLDLVGVLTHEAMSTGRRIHPACANLLKRRVQPLCSPRMPLETRVSTLLR